MKYRTPVTHTVSIRTAERRLLNCGRSADMTTPVSPLRIKGVVRFADRVRRELSGTVSAARQSQLRDEVAEVIRQIDQMVVNHGTRVEKLPSPTRRAYHFLANLDFDACALVSASNPTEAIKPSTGTIRLVGVRAYWQIILRRLSEATTSAQHEDLYESIHSASQKNNRYLNEHDIKMNELTVLSQTICGWLDYFAIRQHFDIYVSAIDRAQPIFNSALQQSKRFHAPGVIEFQRVSGLYRLRGRRDETRVIVPTPMIVFSKEQFTLLAEASVANGDKQPVMAAAASDEYQSVQAELEALGGVVEQASGVYRHLGASFERINQKYFDGSLPRPRLTWSRSFTGRKFGHYDFIRDTVMISCTLDRAKVPEYALDFVLYHELLHKKLGLDWRNGRADAHTREFRAQERMFDHFAEAEATLMKLARG